MTFPNTRPQLGPSLFHTIAANMPGMVYQLVRHRDGRLSFPYLSQGCSTLLGISLESLRAEPALLLELIVPDDQETYIATMAESMAGMTTWNWEGRIFIDAWNDIKWINLRATPQSASGGSVQWVGIMTNITQSKLAEAELKHSRAQLAELSAHIETVKENERAHISREIHDDLGGNLTAIKMALAILTRHLPPDAPALGERAAYVDSLVDRTIETVHRIAGDLRPGVLDFGLVAALEWQAAEYEKLSGVPCEFVSSTSELDLEPNRAIALFRIAQEALTNISKHAQATRVEVRLSVTDQSVELEIADNGQGIAMRDRGKPQSYGIRGMMERSLAIGGKLDVEAIPLGGTLVSIMVPLTMDRRRS
ncbi:MAG: histidine kinase [Janthinobacterium lividum]